MILIKRLAVMLAAVVLALAAAEVLLRTFAPLHLAGIQSAYIFDSQLGIRLRSGLDAAQISDHLEEIHTNPLGTVNFQSDFNGFETLVFALGDSYTQGTGLPSDAAYPFQLDILLNTDDSGAYSKHFAVVNLGLAAYGAEQSLITLRRYAAELGPPQYCLYLGSENDYYDDVLFRGGYRHDSLVEGSPRWGWMAGPMLWTSKFEVSKRFKLAVSQFRRARVSFDSNPAATSNATPVATVAELNWPAIQKIRSACESDGGHFIASWSAMESPSYEWLRGKASESGFGFADWKPRVASVRDAIPAAPLANPHSGGHFRGWVNGEIAAAFAGAIRRLEATSASDAAIR